MKKIRLFLIFGITILFAVSCQKMQTVLEESDAIISHKKIVMVQEGTNMAASLSPDHQTIVLDLQGRLWTLPAKGGKAKPITDPLGDARQPAWSPDGKRICFQGYWEGNWHIYTVAKDGSDLQQLTTGKYDHREPSWSPNGTSILFSSDRAGTYDIWQVTVPTKQIQRITKGEANEFAPAWSSDGRRIAYVSDVPDGSGIYVRDYKEGETLKESASTKQIYTAKGKIAGVTWRPDGTSILFNEATFSKSQLWVQWLDMPDPHSFIG